MFYTDHVGTPHKRVDGPVRIVSLVPSLTELLCSLELTGQIVGRTGFCIHPRALTRRIPKIGGTKVVDVEAVRALGPTHLVVNVDENRVETVDMLRSVAPSIIVTHPLGPLDNPRLYRLLGGIFDRDAQAEMLCRKFEAAYTDCVQSIDPQMPDTRVLYLIWRNPWMTVSRDTYISRVLAAFGWQTWSPPGAERYPVLQIEQCRDAVDRVLLSSEPYAFREKHFDEIERALPGVPVDLIDGESVSWYGPRAIDGLYYLANFTTSRQIKR